MSDAGEGLIDADARIQERMEELARDRATNRAKAPENTEQVRAFESLRLARTELQGQLGVTAHERRREQIQQAIQEVERRMSEMSAAAQ